MGGIMKTVGLCSIDVQGSKNGFGISTSRGEIRDNGILPFYWNFKVYMSSFSHITMILLKNRLFLACKAAY